MVGFKVRQIVTVEAGRKSDGRGGVQIKRRRAMPNAKSAILSRYSHQMILPDLTQKCDLHPSRSHTDGCKDT